MPMQIDIHWQSQQSQEGAASLFLHPQAPDSFLYSLLNLDILYFLYLQYV
jgi:hypothetical protein